MSEIPTLQPAFEEAAWDPEIEAAVDAGTMTPLEAGQGLIPSESEQPTADEPLEVKAERAIARELEYLEEQGFSEAVAKRMIGIRPKSSQPASKSKKPARARQGWVTDKNGVRRKIRTAADSRAADRIPDDDWNLR